MVIWIAFEITLHTKLQCAADTRITSDVSGPVDNDKNDIETNKMFCTLCTICNTYITYNVQSTIYTIYNIQYTMYNVQTRKKSDTTSMPSAKSSFLQRAHPGKTEWLSFFSVVLIY